MAAVTIPILHATSENKFEPEMIVEPRWHKLVTPSTVSALTWNDDSGCLQPMER